MKSQRVFSVFWGQSLYYWKAYEINSFITINWDKMLQIWILIWLINLFIDNNVWKHVSLKNLCEYVDSFYYLQNSTNYMASAVPSSCENSICIVEKWKKVWSYGYMPIYGCISQHNMCGKRVVVSTQTIAHPVRISVHVINDKNRTKKATELIGCAFESWESKLSNAYSKNSVT